MIPLFSPVASVVRNGLPESWHFGMAAAVTPEGRLVARVGDPRIATCLRSAAKPFQCLPLLLAGGVERFGLDAADVALICASHGGTPAHTQRAESLLARGGFVEGDLLCGAHWPMDAEAARALQEAGALPGPLHNNCSGKHAGMLLACLLLGFPPEGYITPEHPLEQRIFDHVAAFCGVPRESLGLSIDGCSVPAFHIPIEAVARGYAALAHPEAAGLSRDVAAAAGTVVRSMTGAPEMVAGPGRFTTRLMQVTGGRVLGKEGAEGFYGIAVRGPVALGVALKVADGGERCRDSLVIDVLRQLGSLSGAEFEELADLYEPPVVNCRGLLVGKVRSEVELEEV
ncbi:MAG TPA: asparaginase [Thermoanaerobaculia bacterium]|nr:asparaginase [Thermoanaerobaculia bacterium]